MKRLVSYSLFLLVLLASLCSGYDTLAQAKKGAKEKEVIGVREKYGKAPDDYVPYKGFRDPYKWFFADEQPFLGTGRDKKPPKDLKTVRLGFMGPLNPKFTESKMGRRMLQGAQLAIEERNAKGGYRSLPYELIIRDDIGLWGSAANKFMEIYDHKVWGVFGAIDGQNTHIAIRVALKLEMPFVTSGSTDPTLTETRIPWYIRVNGDDRQMCYALANHIFKDLKIQRVAALRVNSRYGRVGVGEFRDSARRLGKPLIIEQRYRPGDTDFTEQLKKIKASSAQAIVIWGDAHEAANIVKQMRKMGMKHRVFGCDRLIDPEFFQIAGKAAEGVVASYWFDPTRKDPKWERFKVAYKKRFGEEPEEQAAHAYDGMNLLMDAVENAGLNRPLIRDWMTSLDSYDGVTGKIIFDPTWNDVGPVYLAQAKGGQFKFFGSYQGK